jgi:hypothetical protein
VLDSSALRLACSAGVIIDGLRSLEDIRAVRPGKLFNLQIQMVKKQLTFRPTKDYMLGAAAGLGKSQIRSFG